MKIFYNLSVIILRLFGGLLRRRKNIAVVINCGIGNSILAIPLLQKLKEEKSGYGISVYGPKLCLDLIKPTVSGITWIYLPEGTSVLMHALTSCPNCLKIFKQVIISFNSSDPGFYNLHKLGLSGRIIKAKDAHYLENKGTSEGFHEAVYNIRTILPGYTGPAPVISLEISEDEMAGAESYLAAKNLTANNFIAVHAGWKPDFMVKSLPPAKLREIFSAVKQRNMKIVMVVGPDETSVWNKLSEANHWNTEVTVIDDISNLRLLGAILAKSFCLISADTGVAHLAAAADGKTCVIFGPTSDRRCRPLGKTTTVVIKPNHTCLNCYEKYSSRACFQDEKCLKIVNINRLIEETIND